MMGGDGDRDRYDRDDRDPSRRSRGNDGTSMMLGKVISASPQAGKFFKWSPATLTGAVAEGGAGTITAHPGAVMLAELVQGRASQGDLLLFRFVNYRWVAEGAPSARTPPCDPATKKLTFNVKGCTNAALADADVEVQCEGTVVATGKTDAGGVFLVDIRDNGNYHYLIDKTLGGVKRYARQEGDVFVSACGPQTVNVSLAPNTGFVCCPSVGGVGGTIEYPFSKKLLATHGGGSFTLTWDNSSSWTSPSSTFRDNNAYLCDSFGWVQCGTPPGPNDVSYWTFVGCNGNGGQSWIGTRGCVPPLNAGGPCNPNLQLNVQIMSGYSNSPLTNPFPKTFTVPSMDNLFGAHRSPYPGSMTVSEILP